MKLWWEWAWAQHGVLGRFVLVDFGAACWVIPKLAGVRLGFGVGALFIEWERTAKR